MQVNWYRNASGKDNGNAHGTGNLLEVLFPAQASESIAIIVDTEGNLVEKNLSLVKQAEVQAPVNTLELESTINTLTSKLEEAGKEVERLDLEHAERKVLLEEVSKQLTEAKAEIVKLKKPKPVVKPVSPATTKVTPTK